TGRNVPVKTRYILIVLSLAIFGSLALSLSLSKTAELLGAARGAAALPRLLQPQVAEAWEHEFRLSSKTFENNQFIPASMVFSGQLGSVCSGNNISPELSWTSAGPDTRSYAVALYDVTANFTHWGIYNIPAVTTELAAGAGAPGAG